MKRLALILALLFAVPVFATSIGVWAPQGTVLSTANGGAPGQPNPLYQGNSVILDPGSPNTKVFKLWVSTEAIGGVYGGINYFESADGVSWTAYASNPIIASSDGGSYIRVYQDPDTDVYYMMADLHGVYTKLQSFSSTDGVTWTSLNTSALTAQTQAWEGTLIYASGVIAKISGVYYVAYCTGPLGTSQGYPMGVATTTDFVTFTKYASNPVFNNNAISANAQFFERNGVYYGYSEGIVAGLTASSNGLPVDIVRLSAPNPLGPWAILSTPVAYRTQASEGVGSAKGELGDPGLVEALGNVYMYNTAKADGTVSGGSVINLQIAYSTTIAALVQTYEGMVNIPVPGTGGFELNLVQQAADSFSRANGSLGANWTSLNASYPPAIVSDQAEGTVAGHYNDAIYTNYSWPDDQWSTDTIAVDMAASYAGVVARGSTSGGDNSYKLNWNQSGVNLGTLRLIKSINGANTTLNQINSFSLDIGDNLTLAVLGTTISVFHGRNLIYYQIDSSLAAGSPGVNIGPITATTNAAVTNWSGGTFQASPPIGGGNAGGRAVIF